MTDPAYETLVHLLDAQGPFERHGLLLLAERTSRDDPRPWVVGLRRLRAERPIDPAIVTYLLHLLTNEYAFAQAFDDPAMANFREALRIAMTSDYDDDEEADEHFEEDWPRMEAEANEIRVAMSARRQHVERAVMRALGEDGYADALTDFRAVLASCAAGRDLLLGQSWPLGFGDALRATGDLRTRNRKDNVGFLFDVVTAEPRDVLLAVVDRSRSDNRRAICSAIEELAEVDPYRWLAALNALHAEGRVTADERYYLATEIAVFHVLELQAADAEEARMRRQLESLEQLYGVSDLDAQYCDEDELAALPEELTMLREHLWANQHRYVGAALRELGEADLAVSFVGREENDHYERGQRIEAELFGDRFAPPQPWSREGDGDD